MISIRQLFFESPVFRRVLGFLFHTFGILVSCFFALQIRFDFEPDAVSEKIFWDTFPWVTLSYLVAIFLFRLHRGLWRFFTLRDCIITTFALGVGTLFSAFAVFASNGWSFALYPRSLPIITLLLLVAWEIGGRGFVRLLRESKQKRLGEKVTGSRLLLIGDPEEADALLRGVQRYAAELGKVVGIVSDNRQHHGSKLRGVSIFSGVAKTNEYVEQLEATTLLFMPPVTAPARIREVIDRLSESKLTCDYRVIPSMDELASGKVDVSSIRKVAIEDLLNRVPYDISHDRLLETIRGRRVIVSGAGGSIGSEICRQLLKYEPDTVVLFEISEFHLFLIEREIIPIAAEAGVKLIACAGDVRRPDQLRAAMAKAGGVDLFYHAAAYKHVDLMERNVTACFLNNVVGSQIAASVAEEEGVKDFVLISTDKAVRPTSMMGASKRLAERIIIERPECGTSFKAVRFGNVLGSNGSVVPIFREQIARGGPVTVTSANVTRFFMTISEAVELVLAAGAIPDDRRVFVLEMGEAVRIDAMARRMIELSGFVPDVDIPVVYTGLKPGEKEYEELLTDDENVVRTDLDRIWVVEKDIREDAKPVNLGKLLELIDEADEESLRDYAHSLVPGSRLKEEEPVLKS